MSLHRFRMFKNIHFNFVLRSNKTVSSWCYLWRIWQLCTLLRFYLSCFLSDAQDVHGCFNKMNRWVYRWMLSVWFAKIMHNYTMYFELPCSYANLSDHVRCQRCPMWITDANSSSGVAIKKSKLWNTAMQLKWINSTFSDPNRIILTSGTAT